MIKDKIINDYFIEIRDYLINKENRIKFSLTRNQCVEKNSGIYCFFIDDELKYIGESGCIKKRINDLLNTKNHTFRRSLGEYYFLNDKLYTKTSSTLGFCPEIEVLLSKKMNEHLSFSYLPLKIGRKEFEEWFQDHLPETKFLNKRKKRK